MRREPNSGHEWLWWASWLCLGMLFVRGAGVFRGLLLAAVSIAAVAAVMHLRRLALRRSQDEFSREEAARKERLTRLRSRVEQMETTLTDLRSLRLAEEDAVRARWAEADLEQALTRTREEMTAERARLALLRATRWLAQVEPLLRGLDGMGPDTIRDGSLRIMSVRAEGEEALRRLRADTDAAATPEGLATVAFLEEALRELESMRADLLTRRTAQLLDAPAGEPAALPAAQLARERLQDLMSRARARREVESWLREDGK